MWSKLKKWWHKLLNGPDQETFECICGQSGKWIILDSINDECKVIECSKCHEIYIAYFKHRIWNFTRIGYLELKINYNKADQDHETD